MKVLLEKLITAELVKKYLAFCGSRMFFTESTRAAIDHYPAPDASNPHRHTVVFFDLL
jgi:hypothetical protein